LLFEVLVVGDHVLPWMQQFLGTDMATLTALDSLTTLGRQCSGNGAAPP